MTQVKPVRYAICVEGQIDLSWSEWIEGFSVFPTETGKTILFGYVEDQAALKGFLNRLFAMNLIVISVNRLEPGASPTYRNN